jgi:hypothetical protein
MAVDDAEDDQLASMSTEDDIRASRLLDNEIRVLKVSEPSLRSEPRGFGTLVCSSLGFASDLLDLFGFFRRYPGRVAADEPGVGVVQGEDQGKPG